MLLLVFARVVLGDLDTFLEVVFKAVVPYWRNNHCLNVSMGDAHFYYCWIDRYALGVTLCEVRSSEYLLPLKHGYKIYNIPEMKSDFFAVHPSWSVEFGITIKNGALWFGNT